MTKIFDKKEIKALIEKLNAGDLLFDQLPNIFIKNKDKFKIPIKPIEPEDEECCGSGCTPCVFDTYTDKLEKYEDEIENISNIINEKENTDATNVN